MTLYEKTGYLLLGAAALELMLGYLLLRQNPRSSPAQRAAAHLSFFSAAFSFCTAVMYIRASLGLPYNLFVRANWIGWFTIPAGLQFVYFLKDEHSRFARIAGAVLYLFWSLMLCLSLFTDLIVTGDYVIFPYGKRSGPLDAPVRIFATALILWLMVEVVRLRRTMSGDRKAQLNFFFIGMLIFAGGGALLSGILPVMGGFGVEPGLGSLFGFPWVALAFYAITRYGLFDVRIIISRTLTIVLQALIFSLIQLALFLLLEPTFGTMVAIAISLPFIGFLFFGTRLNSDMERWVSQIVIKGKFDYQQILQDSSRAIVTILDLNELLDYLMKTVRQSLQVRNACLYLRDRDAQFPLRHSIGGAHGSFCRDALPGGAADRLRSAGRPVIRRELEGRGTGGSDGLVDCLNIIRAEIAVPLLYQGELRGVLALGEKGSREPYVQRDIDLLDALASHAAVAIENARLYEAARRATESLSESEEMFHALAQTVPAAIFIHQDGRIAYSNSAGESLTGYPLGELLAKEFRDLVHPDYRGAHIHPDGGGSGSVRGQSQDEFKIIRKDGEERWVIMSAGRIDFAGRPAVIGALFNVTERKNLEGKLRYAQKMEALGKLAGGVAHDFNNILTVIVGYGSRLQARLDAGSPLHRDVDQILASSERAAELIRSLLSFGIRQEIRLGTKDLNEIVLHAERFLAGLLPKSVAFTLRAESGTIPVAADAGQLERVLMNLVVNARDAMPAGGTLTVETGVRELDAEFIRKHGFGMRGHYAFVAVHDTGTGMAEDVRKQIFEPFFSTKGPGKGTGFGLSIVYDIVKEHKGYITVASEPGKGTSFAVYLPLSAEAPRHSQPEQAREGAGGSEKILITDDDEMTRKYARTVLEESGYRVVEAGDGEEAVRKFKEDGGDVRLVIMDMTMPKVNGMEAFRAIRKIRPDVKVLFVSGYNEELLLKTGILEQGLPFLLKPLAQKDLLRTVREILDL